MAKYHERKTSYAGPVPNSNYTKHYVELTADTAADMPDPADHPEWEVGSELLVLEDGGSRYRLSNSREWVKVNFNTGGGGITEEEKAEIVQLVIESLGGNPVFGYVDENNNIIVQGNLPNGDYFVKYEMEDGSTLDIGELVLDTNVYYSVTNNLTNCVSNNSADQAVKGDSYSAAISANSGYELKSVVVTMGGVDISASAVNVGNINIESVTGDIVITAVAEEKAVTEPVTMDIALTDGIRIGSDGGDRTQAGYCATPHIDLTNIPKPCTINLTKALWCTGGNESMVRVYAQKADNTKLVADMTKVGVGDNYFIITDNSGGAGNNVTVTITSTDVGYIRFSGWWSKTGASDSTDSFASANTKATLTYTPTV